MWTYATLQPAAVFAIHVHPQAFAHVTYVCVCDVFVCLCVCVFVVRILLVCFETCRFVRGPGHHCSGLECRSNCADWTQIQSHQGTCSIGRWAVQAFHLVDSLRLRLRGPGRRKVHSVDRFVMILSWRLSRVKLLWVPWWGDELSQ